MVKRFESSSSFPVLVRWAFAFGIITILSGLDIANAFPSRLLLRATPDNTVTIVSSTQNCLVMPKFPHTDIGDSEYDGGTQVFCTASAWSDSSQGLLPSNFWVTNQVNDEVGKNGLQYRQLTGCINPGSIDRLNPQDKGGQYDSSGGTDGHGNPKGSMCLGYNHYIELVEPAGNRACLRCCQDPADCPVVNDTAGCPAVIPGDYNC